ncbi:MAG: FecR family protein [Elusimicrobiota bacterium]
MSRLCKVLCAAALAAVVGRPAWAGGTVAGVVISLKGSPMVIGTDKKEKKLKVNGFVYEGDTVKTDVGELVGIAFVGGAELRINEGSEFVMESGGGRQVTSVKTRVGQAWTRLLHGRAGMQVRSPMAVAAVRGTEADVDVQDRMTVKVYEGLVDVLNDKGKQSLGAGQMAEVGGVGQAPGAPRRMSQGDYGNWQEGLQAKDLDKSLNKLKAEADRIKEKQVQGKGKTIKLKLEKKK